MELLLKKVQILIGSFISTILANSITRIKYESKDSIKGLVLRIMGILLIILPLILTTFPVSPALAIVDPLSVSNNKFGIHILTPTTEEASAAADLVNNQGDWGYVTVLIESKDIEQKNAEAALNKWQTFFEELRKRHLIPLVRIATQPDGNYWKRPDANEATIWAEFLNRLNWPVKNRYVIIYNEPNHGAEWGNAVDPASYAQALNKTIDALKTAHPDFFVLNAGFDASTPQEPPNYMDQWIFMQTMEQTVPGIFNKLDGWISHSYPNPGFIGSPEATGRGTVRTWYWEIQKLRELGVTKTLPIFITETGWKHSEGIKQNNALPSPEKVGEYFKNAFENAWNSNRIVAVTPFLLNYQQEPFDHFSFKKYTGEKQDLKILGEQYPESESSVYYPQYLVLKNMQKTFGKPVQETKAELAEGSIYHSIVAGETYNINLTFKNTGQSIWGENLPVKLRIIYGGQELSISDIALPQEKTVAPGETYTFPISLTGAKIGDYKVVLNLYQGDQVFENKNFEFMTEVKSPVVLIIKAGLKWKESFAGEYSFKIKGSNGQANDVLTLADSGSSGEITNHALLPDYSFDFTINKPYYQSKTVRQEVGSGINTLDFGILEPDIFSAIFNPAQLWNISPFSD